MAALQLTSTLAYGPPGPRNTSLYKGNVYINAYNVNIGSIHYGPGSNNGYSRPTIFESSESQDDFNNDERNRREAVPPAQVSGRSGSRRSSQSARSRDGAPVSTSVAPAPRIYATGPARRQTSGPVLNHPSTQGLPRVPARSQGPIISTGLVQPVGRGITDSTHSPGRATSIYGAAAAWDANNAGSQLMPRPNTQRTATGPETMIANDVSAPYAAPQRRSSSRGSRRPSSSAVSPNTTSVPLPTTVETVPNTPVDPRSTSRRTTPISMRPALTLQTGDLPRDYSLTDRMDSTPSGPLASNGVALDRVYGYEPQLPQSTVSSGRNSIASQAAYHANTIRRGSTRSNMSNTSATTTPHTVVARGSTNAASAAAAAAMRRASVSRMASPNMQN